MPTPLSSTARRLLRSSLRVVGPALAGSTTQRRRDHRAPSVSRILRGEIVPVVPAQPHPLLPAAVRVERSRRHGRDSSGDQVAVTLWFREGPALPGAGGGEGGDLVRIALRLGVGLIRAGAGLAGAAAIGAATVAAARIEAARQPARFAAPPVAPLLPPAREHPRSRR